MNTAALALHAKRPFQGATGVYAAAARHEGVQQPSQSDLRHRRFEGAPTPPGKAPGH